MPMIRPPTTAAVPKGIPTTQPSLRNGANNPNPAWTADGGNAGRRRISAMALNHDPIAFPKLDDAQIVALGKFATLKTFQRGETLFAAGERDFKFFVVKSGEVEIVDRSSGEDTIVTVHGSREFTGDVDTLLAQLSITADETPVVLCSKEQLVRNPSYAQLADCLGIRKPLEQAVYDLAVIGAGPGGLAVAVYGASEGLKTVVLDKIGPGGQ